MPRCIKNESTSQNQFNFLPPFLALSLSFLPPVASTTQFSVDDNICLCCHWENVAFSEGLYFIQKTAANRKR